MDCRGFSDMKTSRAHPTCVGAGSGPESSAGPKRDDSYTPFADFDPLAASLQSGIVQTPSNDTAPKMRTAPLWGLHVKSRYMHDQKSLTLQDAIAKHKGEALRGSLTGTLRADPRV